MEKLSSHFISLVIALVVLTSNAPSSFAQTTPEMFVAKITSIDSNPNPISINSKVDATLIYWLMKNVSNDNVKLTKSNLPFMLAAAMRNMYLNASQISTSGEVFDLVKANPESNHWGLCGTSSDFFILFLERFGIKAKRIGLWNWPGYSHTAVEFYSDKFQKFVFYDPLFGVYLILPSGEPASLADILEDIYKNGFTYQNWRAKPVRIFGLDNLNYRSASDSNYEEYNSIDYGWGLLRSYFFMIADRFEDRTYESQQIEENSNAYGRWKIYDNSAIAGLDSQQQTDFVNQIKNEFDVNMNGRYHLSFFKTQQ